MATQEQILQDMAQRLRDYAARRMAVRKEICAIIRVCLKTRPTAWKPADKVEHTIRRFARGYGHEVTDTALLDLFEDLIPHMEVFVCTKQDEVLDDTCL